MPLSDQLKQLVELHKVAEQAMKGLIVRLWPRSHAWELLRSGAAAGGCLSMD